MADLYRGKRVLWRFVPRGGYGLALRVPVTVKSLSQHRATVLVEHCNKTVTVSRRSLIEPPTMIGAKPEVEPDTGFHGDDGGCS